MGCRGISRRARIVIPAILSLLILNVYFPQQIPPVTGQASSADYGDAPDIQDGERLLVGQGCNGPVLRYPTRLASGGPYHFDPDVVWLGSNPPTLEDDPKLPNCDDWLDSLFAPIVPSPYFCDEDEGPSILTVDDSAWVATQQGCNPGGPVSPPLPPEGCNLASWAFDVSVGAGAPDPPGYANVAVDPICWGGVTGEFGDVPAKWVLRNAPIPAGGGTMVTLPFEVYVVHVKAKDKINWMPLPFWSRFTVSPDPIDPAQFPNGTWDGSGPVGGFPYGETEDQLVYGDPPESVPCIVVPRFGERDGIFFMNPINAHVHLMELPGLDHKHGFVQIPGKFAIIDTIAGVFSVIPNLTELNLIKDQCPPKLPDIPIEELQNIADEGEFITTAELTNVVSESGLIDIAYDGGTSVYLFNQDTRVISRRNVDTWALERSYPPPQGLQGLHGDAIFHTENPITAQMGNYMSFNDGISARWLLNLDTGAMQSWITGLNVPVGAAQLLNGNPVISEFGLPSRITERDNEGNIVRTIATATGAPGPSRFARIYYDGILNSIFAADPVSGSLWRIELSNGTVSLVADGLEFAGDAKPFQNPGLTFDVTPEGGPDIQVRAGESINFNAVVRRHGGLMGSVEVTCPDCDSTVLGPSETVTQGRVRTGVLDIPGFGAAVLTAQTPVQDPNPSAINFHLITFDLLPADSLSLLTREISPDRPDLDPLIQPIVNNGDCGPVVHWMFNHGTNEYPDSLGLLKANIAAQNVFYNRSDLPDVFDEAACRVNGMQGLALSADGQFETLQTEVGVSSGDLSNLLGWAFRHGITEDSRLTPFAAIYALMEVYNGRPDLQAAFPEAANGANLTRLFGWAFRHGITEDSRLTPFAAIYALMEVYNGRPDLQAAFPEAANGANLTNLLAWAGEWGANEDGRLTPYTAIYKLMWVYRDRPDLQAAFPEAANGANLTNLYCWAKNHGVFEDSRLTPFASFYNEQCP
jgi:hypothetical protein